MYSLCRDALATTLSALYGKLLVVMGTAFPMAEVISTYIPPSFYEVYYLYLYIGSMFFLLYMYTMLLKDKRQRRKEEEAQISKVNLNTLNPPLVNYSVKYWLLTEEIEKFFIPCSVSKGEKYGELLKKKQGIIYFYTILNWSGFRSLRRFVQIKTQSFSVSSSYYLLSDLIFFQNPVKLKKRKAYQTPGKNLIENLEKQQLKRQVRRFIDLLEGAHYQHPFLNNIIMVVSTLEWAQ